MATSISPTAKKSSGKPAKNDKFGLYVIIFVISLLILFAAYYLYTHTPDKPVSIQNYVTLPETVVSHDDQAVKLEVTLDVDEKDHDWLIKNQQAINAIYQDAVQKFDPDMFRSPAGLEKIQQQLRDDINQQMKVNKIKAVYYKNLLVQYKE